MRPVPKFCTRAVEVTTGLTGLLTQDPKANTVEYQKTILLEVPPISKWDLVVKEPRGGGRPALYLVASVRREIRF